MLIISIKYFWSESHDVPEMLPSCTFNKGWGMGVGGERAALLFGRFPFKIVYDVHPDHGRCKTHYLLP